MHEVGCFAGNSSRARRLEKEDNNEYILWNMKYNIESISLNLNILLFDAYVFFSGESAWGHGVWKRRKKQRICMFYDFHKVAKNNLFIEHPMKMY